MVIGVVINSVEEARDQYKEADRHDQAEADRHTASLVSSADPTADLLHRLDALQEAMTELRAQLEENPDGKDEEPGELEFSGTQSQVSEPFELSAGLLRVAVAHEGDGYISVSLYDPAGGSYYLTSGEGPFDISQAEQLEEAGTYVLKVEVDPPGAWTVRLQQ
jgi:hypothetical protein